MVSVSNFDNDDQEKTSVIPSETFKGRIEKAGQSPACLVCLVGPAAYVGRQWELLDPEFVIGRSMKASIFVDDPSVSKSHAKLMITPTEVVIQDLDSTNKTIVNSLIIPSLKLHRLQHNDQIKTGNVIFKYLAPGSIEAVTNRETYDRSQMDALTGVFNKGAMLSKAPELMKRAEILGQPVSVIIFDIDFFKRINDTHGHLAGDYVLKELAQVIATRQVRGSDFFARYGGEEFVLMLNNSTLKQAIEVAERIRTTIETHKFVFEGTQIKVTLSGGVATKGTGIQTWDELIKIADAALYMSKQSGRNRISTS